MSSTKHGKIEEAVLPPYGALPAGLPPSKDAPADWRDNGSEDFGMLLVRNLLDFQRLLWPPDDMDQQIELTKVDLELLLQIRADRLLDKLPDSPVRSLNCNTHKDFFKLEDTGEQLGALQRHYDRTADQALVLNGLPRVFIEGIFHKMTSGAIFFFKQELQRPRPYQAAYILGFTAFNYEEATSALHPSMISGHCIQGLMGGVGIFERLLLDRIPFSEDSWTALQQFIVDFGDRRVMAGVHYPSDNISSWLLALDLCKHVCEGRVAVEVKERLWTAISTRSIVYKRIEAAIGSSESHVYKLAWDELQKRGVAES